MVAVMSSQTQNGEKTTTERWWLDLLDMGYFMPRPCY